MKRFILTAILIAGIPLLLYPACVHANFDYQYPQSSLDYGPSLINQLLMYLPYLSFAIVLEIPVYLIAGMKDKKSILAIIAANLTSLLVFHIIPIKISSPASFQSGWIHSEPVIPLLIFLVIIVEVGAILLETAILKLLLQYKSWKKLLLIVTIANITAIIGGAIIVFLFSLIGYLDFFI